MKDMNGLRIYERCGHSAIISIIHRRWQDCETILGCVGKRRKRAIEKHEQFIEEGLNAGTRPDLVGGDLIWSQVLSIKRAGSKILSDERILGSSDFVKNAIRNAEENEKETLRLNSNISGLEILADQICYG
ncbi:MAG: hypothetical protein SV775_15710 [Thermodesulfobacteriota bacterium]|nr:hypothetical protein [Thermodesulfobacteriota bacterium]